MGQCTSKKRGTIVYASAAPSTSDARTTATPSPAPVPLMIITDAGADLDDEMALILARQLVALGHLEVRTTGRRCKKARVLS